LHHFRLLACLLGSVDGKVVYIRAGNRQGVGGKEERSQ